jgi:glycosyltransferase involved in cell wall biosynthesis
LHITALVEAPEHVCCRYRLAAFRPALEQAGHHLELLPVRNAWWPGNDLRRADVIVLQRKLLPTWQLFLLRRAARNLVFDFDDAVFHRDSYAGKGVASPRRWRRFTSLAACADGFIAGNSFLAARLLAAGADANQVTVIPTCVDPAQYPVARHEQQGSGLQLVWVGSSSTLRGLETVRLLLEALGAAGHGWKLKLICDRFLDLRHLPVIECPWSEETEADEIASADIGISWLPDDAWSRGKCGLKVLQYMAAGLPVIGNPVGVQAEMIEHGVTGFLATRPGEWLAAVRRLADSPELRRQMGAAARQRVEERYSVQVGAEKWQNLVGRFRSRQAA